MESTKISSISETTSSSRPKRFASAEGDEAPNVVSAMRNTRSIVGHTEEKAIRAVRLMSPQAMGNSEKARVAMDVMKMIRL